MELSNFPHYVLINNSGVKFKDFSEDLKVSIKNFERRHKGWNLKKKPEDLNNLIADSKILSQYIFDHFVEEEDQQGIDPGNNPQAAAQVIANQEPEPEPTPNPEPAPDINAQFEATLNKNELVVHKMYMAGVITAVTKEQLKGYGYDTSWTGPLGISGARHKHYSVVRDTRHSGLVYNIIKHQ